MPKWNVSVDLVFRNLDGNDLDPDTKEEAESYIGEVVREALMRHELDTHAPWEITQVHAEEVK